MEPTLDARLAALEEKLDKTFKSAEKTRKYIQWGFIATVVAFVLPLIGIALVAPSFVGTYTGELNSLSQ